MIRSVRGRGAFEALRLHGRRAGAGAVRITFNPDATASPRLAFAIGRQVGSAVVRNRARRRLRVVFAELAAARPDLVPPGDYLVAVYTSDFETAEARQWLTQALAKLQAS